MAETKTQIINRALRSLGPMGSGQEASAEDAKDIGDLFAPMLRTLDAKGVLDFYDPDNGTKDEWATDIAFLLAMASGDMFGVTPDAEAVAATEARLQFMGSGPAPTINDVGGTKTRADLIRRALQIALILGPDREPHACTTRGVRRIIRPWLDGLEAEGLVGVPNDNLFEARLLEPLAVMLSVKVAPMFGRAAEERAVPSAIQSIRVMEAGRPTYETARGMFF